MTDEQIKNGYWHIKCNPPPNSITYFADYNQNSALSLNITQLEINATQQKKLINDWCLKLPELTSVKYLWLCTRVNQKIFDAVCRMVNLETLWIKWSGIKNIDGLAGLKKLKHLHIGSSSQIENINILGTMKSLVTLDLEQLNKISNFSIVSELTQLEGLGLNGSIWTAQKIDTLNPVSALKNLKYLTVLNSQIHDKSFDPILKLPNLVRFHCSWNYPEGEFKKLKSMPNLKYGNVETSWTDVKQQIKSFFFSEKNSR